MTLISTLHYVNNGLVVAVGPDRREQKETLAMRHAQFRSIMMAGFLALPLGGCAAGLDVEDAEAVQVTDQALDLPDLIVESFTLTTVTGGVQMTTVIKNQGTVATGNIGYAFQNYRQVQVPYTPSGCSFYGGTWAPSTGALAAGASRTFTTTLAGWTISSMEGCAGTWYTKADAITNSVTESDETNNEKYGRD